MDCKLDESVADVRLEHDEKVPSLKVVTEFGIIIDVKLEHDENA